MRNWSLFNQKVRSEEVKPGDVLARKEVLGVRDRVVTHTERNRHGVKLCFGNNHIKQFKLVWLGRSVEVELSPGRYDIEIGEVKFLPGCYDIEIEER